MRIKIEDQAILYKLAFAHMLAGMTRAVADISAKFTKDPEAKKTLEFVQSNLLEIILTLYEVGVFSKDTEALLDKVFEDFNNNLKEQEDKA